MKQFVLVAGADYDRSRLKFRVFADNRVNRIVARNRTKEDLVFRTFDVDAGSVTTATYPGGKRAGPPKTDRPFRPATAADFDRTGSGNDVHGQLKDGRTGLMSVTDVYSAVRKIGVDAAGTLHELSFFSHAWHGGPILLNSTDDGQVTGPPTVPGGPPTVTRVGAARDPDDFDPRAEKDFQPPTTTAGQLTQFRAAFHPDGIGWSWGCTFPRVVHQILTKLERHPDYRRTGLTDTQVFEFHNFEAEHVQMLRDWLGVPVPEPRKVTLTFGELKHFFRLVTVDSYNHHLAVAADRKVYASVVGAYSEFDTGPSPLMHVAPVFAAHFTFYANYLGFTFDPEGRRYGAYLPTFTA